MTFKNCPYCGKDPEILQQQSGEDHYYIASCPDMECEGYNREVFDSAEACAAYWNAKEVVNGGAQDGVSEGY